MLNLLTGNATIDGAAVEFAFAEELQEWLRGRANVDGLGWGAFQRAELEVRFSCLERPGRSRGVTIRQLAFECRSVIETSAGEYTAVRASKEVGVREGNGPWAVH